MDEQWHVLTWNGRGWNFSELLTGPIAQTEYERQVRQMPNCPAKLVCLTTLRDHAGNNPSALRTPYKPGEC